MTKHTITATNATEKPAKLYDLFYRGQAIVIAQPYPVCVGAKNQKIGSGCFFKMYFDIKEHK